MKHFKVWDGGLRYSIDAERFEIDERGYLRFFSREDEVGVFNYDKWIEVRLVIPEFDFSKLDTTLMYKMLNMRENDG